MQTLTANPRPLFELKGPLGRIDLSAWLSGLSFALGIALAGDGLAARIVEGSPLLWLLPMSYLGFLLAVLLIQRHMRLALTASSFGKPQRLTTSGLFRYSRNPIYVAFLLPLASIGIASLPAAAIAIAAYMLAMNLTVIRSEERDLTQTFGADFTAYAARTPRWL